MFSKLIVAAIVGVALAGQDDDAIGITKQQALTSSFTSRLAARLAAAQVNHGMLRDGIETAAVSINRVAAMKSTISDAQDSVDALKDSSDAAVADAIDDLSTKLAEASAALHDELANKVQTMGKAIVDTKNYASDIVGGGMGDIKALSDDSEDQINAANAVFVEQQKCAAQKLIFNKAKGECMVPALSATAYMDHVSHSLWTNEDSRDSGYLTSRDLQFTKFYDNTYVRIMYYDNMRIRGHTAYGKWSVHICDGGGGNCDPCSDPGALEHWRWSGHQHGWWMNDHTGGTIFGLCKATSSLKLVKGEYSLRVMVGEQRYDLHTGHQGSHGSFTVDEVMKY